MIKLENAFLRVHITETGGKMRSIYGKKEDLESDIFWTEKAMI